MMRFTRDSLPPVEEFNYYRKSKATQAVRMDGPFECITIDGNIAACEDGWLAIDSHGYPYPIDNRVFEESFEPVGS